jgi:hypothetical protein
MGLKSVYYAGVAASLDVTASFIDRQLFEVGTQIRRLKREMGANALMGDAHDLYDEKSEEVAKLLAEQLALLEDALHDIRKSANAARSKSTHWARVERAEAEKAEADRRAANRNA